MKNIFSIIIFIFLFDLILFGEIFSSESSILPPSNITAEVKEDEIKIFWDRPSEKIKGYKVYRNDDDMTTDEWEELVDTTENFYIDKNLPSGKTFYYFITAYSDNESVDSDIFSISTKAMPSILSTVDVSALEIEKIDLEKIFSANYKYYIENPVANISIKNNTDKDILKVKITFKIADYMDFPSQRIVDVKAKSSANIPIFATFNNKILEIGEDTPLQSEIKIIYQTGDGEKVITKNVPVLIYSKNALMWDDKRRIATFVTPKDDVLKDFARGVVQQYVKENEEIPLPQNLLVAREIFSALSVYGITYIPDPTNPYQVTSEQKDKIDYVQFPRETLKHKSGDCDDLTCLYAALLENIAIQTSLIDVPGHLFVMFDTEIDEIDEDEFGFPKDMYVKYKGTLWIPVEATLIGSSFLKAWQEGAKQFKKWEKEKNIDIIDLRSAWNVYKPATLPPSKLEYPFPTKEQIESKFKNEIEEIITLKLNNLCRLPKSVIDINPYDVQALLQLGIIYAENKMYDEAEKYFQKVLEINKNNAVALNNLGNIYLLKDNFDKAIEFYTKASEADPKDPEILVNLSISQYKKGLIKDAKITFQKAKKMDRNIVYGYSELEDLLK